MSSRKRGQNSAPGIVAFGRNVLICSNLSYCYCFEKNRSFIAKVDLPSVSIYSYAGVRRWTKKVDIFAYAHLAIPCNVSRSHWVLLHIDNDAKKVCCYDSYGGCHKREIGALIRYLQDEFSARHPGKRARYYTSTPDGKPVRRQPSQGRNATECGVFLCAAARHILRGDDLAYGMNEIRVFRSCITLELLERRIR